MVLSEMLVYDVGMFQGWRAREREGVVVSRDAQEEPLIYRTKRQYVRV